MKADQKAAAIFLCGYLRGKWMKHGEKPEQMVIDLLRTLEVPERLLPKIDPPPTGEPEHESHV